MGTSGLIAVQGHASPRCNRILKDFTVQSAQKLHLYGPPEIKERITRWNANGQHGIFAGARRYLRLMRSLVLNEIPYLGPEARALTTRSRLQFLSRKPTFRRGPKPHWPNRVIRPGSLDHAQNTALK